MSKKEQVEQLTDYMANFVSYIAKVLPDDIIAKLDELAEKEDSPLSKVIYETMKKNQVLAKELNSKMWNKFSVDWGIGDTFKRSCYKIDSGSTASP